MKIEDIKNIVNKKFYEIIQDYLIEDQWPNTNKSQKEPYKKIHVDNKRKANYLIMRIEMRDLTIFSSDKNPPKGLLGMCDYFIFVESNQNLIILMIELKGSDVAHAKSQLNAGECFINYIIETAKRISINVDNIDKKKIIIKEGSGFKRETSYEPYRMDNDGIMTTYCNNKNDSFRLQFFIQPRSI